MIYKTIYITMLLSFIYLSIQGGDLKTKALGILFAIANAIIFWKG